MLKFWEISPKQIEEKQRQSQIITGERLPSWSLNLVMKFILMIFTTENDSPNLAHRFLMAFSYLEKKKTKHFQEKHYSCARANTEQKPHRAS